ncbi:MAG: hypothetical protein ACTSRZ_00445 [Promethearchaeota archaeon]
MHKLSSLNQILKKSKKFIAMQIIISSIVLVSFFSTIIIIKNPDDYLPDKISLPDRKGTIFGYTFLEWETLMANETNAAKYMDLAARSLNCCYVHCQWEIVGLSNNSLNLNYLGNLSLYIKGLAARGLKVQIYTWISSYSPSWMFNFVPELVDPNTGKCKTCWYGINPNSQNTTEIQHRNILKWSMLHYYDLLSQYFIDNELEENISGWNLDDETNIDPNSPDGKSYWNDFFKEITDLLHSKSDKWEVHAMWLSINTYEIAGIAGFDVNAFDAYCQDQELIQRITYSYQNSGVEKCSVVLSAMFLPNDIYALTKMRRLAWICWFMGVDEIGWYSFYYGDMEGESWTCAILHYNDPIPKGPERTKKTDAVEEIARDYYLLNKAWKKIEAVGRTTDFGKKLENKLIKSYYFAKASMFDKAMQILMEVINA